ncbi:RNAse III [Cedratvirus lausannensis]|uniref:RNAse III n=2 Tax=Pithoviruses TaxID=2023203 RepID=A0A285PXH7_9VIRU|nr:RNAse III [Cedratvirus lausannensis]SPN79921.1 RNAse III [Cedratvirus Zaza IHUMI]
MQLAKFLEEEIFPTAGVPVSLVPKLLSKDNMPFWEAAFTHESYNRNNGKNYDQFEKLGDSVLKTSYVNFLLEKYPTISSSELSSLSAHYLSKPVFADISVQLGLGKHMKTSVAQTLSSNEDLFESLIGALFWIGNRVGYGKGFIIADQFVKSIFIQIPIDMEVTRGPAKTQIKEIFEALKWGQPVGKWYPSSEGSKLGTFVIRYTPTAVTFLRDQGLPLVSDVLAEATGTTKKVASGEANRKALAALEEIGLTKEWANAYNKKLEMNSPELVSYLPSVEAKADKEGFVNLYFQTVSTTNEGKTVQLVGELENGERVILRQISSNKPVTEIHRDLFVEYLR